MADLTRREFIGGAAAAGAAFLAGSTGGSYAMDAPLKIEVDGRNVLGRNDPFWTGILFHPTEYLSTQWGRERLKEWRETGATQTYIRFYNQPEDAVRVNSDGSISYDWEHFDEREYFKLYDFFADAAKGVSSQIQIGGPAYGSTRTYHHPEEWREFIEHVVSGTNHATGKKGAPIDYLSIHTYGASGGEGSPLAPQPSIEYIIAQQRRLVNIRDEYTKLEGLPLYVAEWGLSSGGSYTVDSKPLTVTRNSQYGAAFLAALAERLIQWRRSPDNPNIANLMFCPSGYESTRCEDFRGRRTLDTVNGYHKPIWNGYKLLAKLGDELVAVNRSQDDDRVRVIATRGSPDSEPDGH